MQSCDLLTNQSLYKHQVHLSSSQTQDNSSGLRRAYLTHPLDLTSPQLEEGRKGKKTKERVSGSETKHRNSKLNHCRLYSLGKQICNIFLSWDIKRSNDRVLDSFPEPIKAQIIPS